MVSEVTCSQPVGLSELQTSENRVHCLTGGLSVGPDLQGKISPGSEAMQDRSQPWGEPNQRWGAPLW